MSAEARSTPRKLPPRHIPLAWRNLTESPWRLLASVAGTAFAVVLMFVENGFRNALLDNMVAVASHLKGDLVITHRGRYILMQPLPFARRRLDTAASVAGVASVHPFYIRDNEEVRWRNPATGITRRIRLLAYPPEDDLLAIPEVEFQLAALRQPDVALADTRSKADLYGPFKVGEESELRGRRIKIVGLFTLGTDFKSNGTLLLSERNMLRYDVGRSLTSGRGDTQIDVGVVRLKQGVDPLVVKEAIREALPPDVIVLTRQELIAKEQKFWERVTPVGVVFDIGLVMGLIVGSAICYQILFSEVADRLSEFATLKAIGYTNKSLQSIVVSESVQLAVLGYAAGLGLSMILFRILQEITGLSMVMSFTDALMVLGLTLGMCVGAGLIASRKLHSADPADLFG